jgi:DNA-binding beta-propeller fold protein YncE
MPLATAARLACALVVSVAGAGAFQRSQAPATLTTCNQPASQPIVHVPLPGRPFQPLATSDGCWIFVTMSSTVPSENGVAVLRRAAGRVSLARVVPFEGGATSLVMTRDGTLVMVAAGDRVVFLDPARLTSGQSGAVLGSMIDPGGEGRVNLNVSPDDRYLFVSEERSAAIAVIDLGEARRSHFNPASVVGRIPVGNAPIALTFSLDGKRLYTTSQSAPVNLGWPRTCRPEGSDAATPANHAFGAVIVADVAPAEASPAHSVVATVPAGCNPVRLVLSPDGARAYVSARGDDALLVFDTKALTSDGAHALVARVPVGTAPVGIAVIDAGKKIVVTNSNRFAGSAADHQDLTVIDAANVSSGAAAIIGSIPAGGFPRELRTTEDGRTLLLTNFTSKTLEIVDLDRLAAVTVKR